MNIRDYSSVSARRSSIEKATKTSLQHVGSYTLDEHIAANRNCENMIGIAQVPMGIAGPITMQSVQFKTKKVYLPLATTEGALVASVSRGCKAIEESGAVAVDSNRVGATRGPVFYVENVHESAQLNTFLEKNLKKLQAVAKETSQHLTLTSYSSNGVGRHRFVRFVFDTQDAMGMNMATIATAAIASYIEEKTGIRCLSIAGNYDVDKKPSWLNFIEGRGIQVWAEATISSEVLKNTLKTTAPAVYKTWIAKCMTGSVMAGALGFNAHAANVVAALFLATGQDIAHVSEASMCVTTTEVSSSDDLYISIYLPDLMVGTVGGGTGLATQREALALLGVAGGSPVGGGKNAERLAEIVGAAVLAGELSLLASLSEGSLARAHKRLARGNA